MTNEDLMSHEFWCDLLAICSGIGLIVVAAILSYPKRQFAKRRAAAPTVGLTLGLAVSTVAGLALPAAWLDSLLPDVPLSGLAQLLSIAAVGTAALAGSRSISLDPRLLRWPISTIAMLVALAQLILFWTGAHGGDTAAELTLFAVSLGWPAVTMILLAVSSGQYRHGLEALLHLRIALAITRLGILAVGLALGIALATTLWGRNDAVRVIASCLRAAGAGMIAVGTLLPLAAPPLRPAVTWLRLLLAYHRLSWLYSKVIVHALEWATLPADDDPVTRGTHAAEGRVFRRVLAIRAACWGLLGDLTEDRETAAVVFAHRHADPPTLYMIAATAEACALAEAIDSEQTRTNRSAPRATIAPSLPDDARSLAEEAAFLVTVGKIWQRWERDGLMQRYLATVRAQPKCNPSTIE